MNLLTIISILIVLGIVMAVMTIIFSMTQFDDIYAYLESILIVISICVIISVGYLVFREEENED